MPILTSSLFSLSTSKNFFLLLASNYLAHFLANRRASQN
jgi:hypothetical protein